MAGSASRTRTGLEVNDKAGLNWPGDVDDLVTAQFEGEAPWLARCLTRLG